MIGLRVDREPLGLKAGPGKSFNQSNHLFSISTEETNRVKKKSKKEKKKSKKELAVRRLAAPTARSVARALRCSAAACSPGRARRRRRRRRRLMRRRRRPRPGERRSQTPPPGSAPIPTQPPRPLRAVCYGSPLLGVRQQEKEERVRSAARS